MHARSQVPVTATMINLVIHPLVVPVTTIPRKKTRRKDEAMIFVV